MMIEAKNILKKYADCTAVNNVSLFIEKGEFIAITGRSGSGKSTLLKCVSGLLKPDSGNVLIGGMDIHAIKGAAARSRFRNLTTGFVFQSYALEPKYTAFENIEIPLLIRGVSKAERSARVLETAEFIGIADILRKPAELLSGGEKQRTAIARALINDPPIIFADEPCGNLDKKTGDAVMELFLRIKSRGTTIVMVTHQHEDALKADRIVEMLDGEIINENT